MGTLHPDCERARFWSSLALDGELSELERAALDEHLRRCDACRRLAAASSAVTGALRAAPLEQPRARVLPERPRRLRPAMLVAAAVVVVAAAGAGSLVGSLSSSGSSARPGHANAAAQAPFIEQQLLALANGVALPRRGGGHGRVIAS